MLCALGQLVGGAIQITVVIVIVIVIDPSNRLATVHERYRQDRTDNGPIA